MYDENQTKNVLYNINPDPIYHFGFMKHEAQLLVWSKHHDWLFWLELAKVI